MIVNVRLLSLEKHTALFKRVTTAQRQMMSMKKQNTNTLFLMFVSVVLLFITAPVIPAQSQASSQSGTIVRETLHSSSLEQTVTRESPDRNITIYLPPNYDVSPNKRYPVVYLLHGVGDTDKTWTEGKAQWSNIQSLMDEGITGRDLRPDTRRLATVVKETGA